MLTLINEILEWVNDVWSTGNWYLRQLAIILVGYPITVILLWCFGCTISLSVIGIMAIIALAHLVVIRFQYPMVLIGLSVNKTTKELLRQIPFAVAGESALALFLSVAGLMVDDGADWKIRVIIALGTLTILLFSMATSGDIQASAKRMRAYVGFVIFTAFFLGLFPHVREKLPERQARIDQVLGEFIGTASGTATQASAGLGPELVYIKTVTLVPDSMVTIPLPASSNGSYQLIARGGTYLALSEEAGNNSVWRLMPEGSAMWYEHARENTYATDTKSISLKGIGDGPVVVTVHRW